MDLKTTTEEADFRCQTTKTRAESASRFGLRAERVGGLPVQSEPQLSTVASRRERIERVVAQKAHRPSWGPFGCALWFLCLACIGYIEPHSSAGEIDFPIPSPSLGIHVTADEASQTTQGSYRVYQLRGHCAIHQGAWDAKASEAVLWIDESPRSKEHPTKIILYLEGDVVIEMSPSADADNVHMAPRQQIHAKQWMGRLFSHQTVDVQCKAWKKPTDSLRALDWGVNLADLQENGSVANPSQVIAAQFQSNATSMQSPSALQSLPPPAFSGSPSRFEVPSSNVFGGIVLDGNGKPVESKAAVPNPAPIPQPTQQTSLQPMLTPPGSRVQARSFQISGRTSQEAQIQTIQRPERGDSIVTITRGFKIQIGGVQTQDSKGNIVDLGRVLLEADSAVLWTRDFAKLISNGIDDEPLEIYLEGHIVFQQGQRVIYADRMYYNAQSEYGMVLSAEVLTPVPQYEGLLRLKADVIQQKSRSNFLAYDAALTSSRLGVPRYWAQSSKVEFTDDRVPSIDPITGQSTTLATPGATDMEADARNNFIYLSGVPVFYWPILSTNIERPSFYLNSIKFRNDQIFGFQTMLDWDLYQLLGINGLNGTDWTLSTDYLSKRGFAAGTNFRYDLPNGILPGPTAGYFDFWGLDDRGLDFLGNDRFNLVPESDFRGRALFRHRKYLSKDLEFMAEGGWISDRNFLEQYFEREWDQEKDFATGLRLRRYADNQMFDLWGQARVNKFLTETEWLPRIDHYWLGQSIADRLTWYAHSNVGYAHQRIATTPVNAPEAAKFQLQAGEVDAEGIRAATRQEIDLPFNLGPVRFVPYLSGEAAHWGEDVTGNDLTRLTGQAGVRSTLPIWRLYPNVESRLFNIKGIAHKATFESDFFYADSDKDLTQIPLYDPIDDNAQEHFRRRLVFNTFAGALPPAVRIARLCHPTGDATLCYRYEYRSGRRHDASENWAQSTLANQTRQARSRAYHQSGRVGYGPGFLSQSRS